MIREFQDEYRWLSNFWLTPVEYDYVTYPSVEHAYMSAKSRVPKWKQFCADKNNSPGKIKRKSREIKVREDWDRIKLDVMKKCLISKFKLNDELRQKLILTGNQNIQEGNNWGDKFWGICLKTGEGENHLGRLLMNIRDHHRQELLFLTWKDLP